MYAIRSYYGESFGTFTLGGGLNQYRGNHYGFVKWMKYNVGLPHDYEWYRSKSLKTDYNLFLKGTFDLSSRLSVYGDLQTRGINYTMDGFDDDGTRLDKTYNWFFVNPKAGINYAPDANRRYYRITSYNVCYTKLLRCRFGFCCRHGAIWL